MKGIGVVVLTGLLIASTLARDFAAGAPQFDKSTSGSEQKRTLSFAERVAYQYALEEVYWRHRIWPKENPGPKPSLDEIMSAAQIEKKVEDYLRNSQLLATPWRPVTPEQLQAEMERMASHTKQPDVLRELFAALGNDPFVIAECLAQPVLADRLSVGSAVVGGVPSASRDLFTADTAASAGSRLGVTTNADNAQYKLPEISAPLGCPNDSWVQTSVPYSAARAFSTAVWTGSEMIVWGGSGPGVFFSNTGGRYNPSTDSWIATTITNAPAERQLHTAVWTGTEMIVWGGNSGSSNVNTGGRYNPNTDSWVVTSVTDAPGERQSHTAVWTGSEMIIWGGFILFSPFYTNTGGRYNPGTDTWLATDTTTAPTARYLHTAVWTGNEMIVWGGSNQGGIRLNTGGKYNAATNSWTPTNTINAPARRERHTAVWTGSEMIVWGGASDSPNFSLNTGGRYNPSMDSWVVTSVTNAPARRSGHTAVWTGSEMIVWGGNNGSDLNTGGRYIPGTDSWISINTTNAPTGRISHTAIWTGSEMVIWGGYLAGTSTYLNTGGRYNPSTDTWVATSAHTTRYVHTAVWTGTEMIVWGGQSDTAPFFLNTGGRYNPATDHWLAPNITGAPAARYFHTAVWTGAEMIVWGGRFGFTNYMNTGGRYNPNTNSWIGMTVTDAPGGRTDHTAVWTGSEMIVWGGSNETTKGLNTGGRYNPSTDNWVATTIINVPAARESHTAVWTGSEMIVWGGCNKIIGDLNTGGRYNPSTNNWVATTITNVPSPRELHTAVWTGSEMIVWGGQPWLNSGGKYDPRMDSWVRTSTTSAPAGRALHTAVWTGIEMIIWGGGIDDSQDQLNTGGRYNPGTDGWVDTTTVNAPARRNYHTAVWTGSKMIVWGGYDKPVSLNTGGIYCAQSSTSTVQSAVSRKTHGSAGAFDLDLPLTGTPGIECRAGGATNDYSVVITFASAVTVNGSPQAQVISGTATMGSGGVSNGGMVTISGNSVTVPLTNVANAQTINVRLNGVTGSSGSGNITIPMSILVGDTNANGAVNSGDVAQTKARLGQALDATNFRSDVNANGAINAGDVSQIKSLLGTGLP